MEYPLVVVVKSALQQKSIQHQESSIFKLCKIYLNQTLFKTTKTSAFILKNCIDFLIKHLKHLSYNLSHKTFKNHKVYILIKNE